MREQKTFTLAVEDQRIDEGQIDEPISKPLAAQGEPTDAQRRRVSSGVRRAGRNHGGTRGRAARFAQEAEVSDVDAIAAPLHELNADTFLAALLEAENSEPPPANRARVTFTATAEEDLSGTFVEDSDPSIEAPSWAARSMRLSVLALVTAVVLVPLTALLSSGALANVGDRPFRALDNTLQLLRAAVQAAGF